ncbi:MAG: serine protease, partial [Spirochaetales bacterium]|nr:serine protease [Spirochaetales bacterium]
MKKKYLCLFFLLFSGSLLFAQVDIGQQVLIVRANESENSEKLTAVIVDWLDENGFEKDAEAFRKYVSTGSGAVVEAPNGDLLVATSAHVMSQASTADVEVPAYGMNDQVLYQDLPVVYRSNKQDLCLLLLPEEARRTLAPMEISMEYSDGDDVLAAGYPSLMGEPSWQVCKGYISSTRANNLVFDVDLAGSVIQHSAPLSPGSSGGPLLVKEGEEYRVIGINSWLVARSFDSRIFFSVPAEDLLAVLDDYAGLSSLSFADKEFMLQKKMNLMDDIFSEQDEELTDREKRAMVIPARDLFSVDYVLADG